MSEQSTTERHLQTRDGAGHDADSPREIPAKGWWQISRSGKADEPPPPA